MFKAYWSLDTVPEGFAPCALTIGNFDGIHLGHQEILDRTLEKAKQTDVQAAVLIFDPHPTRIVAPERAPALLSRPAERMRRFGEYGLDAGVVLRFDVQVASLSPEQFVELVLVRKLHVRWVIVGANFRFGHRQAGDFQTLVEMGRRYGFEAEAVNAVLFAGEPVSSTRIRELVRDGKVDQARRLLGRAFTLEGPIVSGHGVGSRHTVPTLNLAPDAEVLPAKGVYVTETREPQSGRCWESVTNVGNRPTFDGRDLSVETHLLEEPEGEPPARIQLAFYQRLRDEKRFESPESLKQQILLDAEGAQRFFRRREAAGVKSPKTF